MSSPRARRAGDGATAGPAPAGAIVALLERRGRFLTAEPLFPRRDVAGSPQRRRGAVRLAGFISDRRPAHEGLVDVIEH